MTYLTRDDILHADDIPVEVVEVPEWGGSVRVRGMTGTERDGFEAALVGAAPSGNRQQRRSGSSEPTVSLDNVRAKLVARCVVDDDDTRIFVDADVEALGAKSGAALSRVFDAACRLSGIRDGDVDDLAQDMVQRRPFAAGS